MIEIFTQRLSKEQLLLLPTEENVAFYQEHGWYISKKVLSDEIIEEAIRGSERYYRRYRTEIPPGSTTDCRSTRVIEKRSDQLSSLLELLL